MKDSIRELESKLEALQSKISDKEKLPRDSLEQTLSQIKPRTAEQLIQDH